MRRVAAISQSALAVGALLWFLSGGSTPLPTPLAPPARGTPPGPNEEVPPPVSAPQPTIGEPVRVEGLVLSAVTGQSIEGAALTVEDGRCKFSARTDARGVWALDLPPMIRPNHTVRVCAEAYAPGVIWRLTDLLDRTEEMAWPVFLHPVTGHVHGRVVDGAGRPVAAARIVGSSFAGVIKADGSGRFGPVPVVPGENTFRAWSPNHAMGRCRLRAARTGRPPEVLIRSSSRDAWSTSPAGRSKGQACSRPAGPISSGSGRTGQGVSDSGRSFLAP